MTNPTPVLETARLRLRPYRDTDIPQFTDFYASDASRFVGGPCNDAEAFRILAAFAGHALLRGYGAWALEELKSGDYVGQVALWNPVGWPEPEVGWILTERGRGKGYATEAGARARRHAYEALRWRRITSVIDPSNAASIAVATRLGARRVYDFLHRDGRALDVYVHPSPAELGIEDTAA